MKCVYTQMQSLRLCVLFKIGTSNIYIFPITYRYTMLHISLILYGCARITQSQTLASKSLSAE